MRALTVVPGRAGSGAAREVTEPTPADGETLVDVVGVGLCGTDAGIERREYGRAPDGDEVLILGHEGFGRVARDTASLGAGTPVVASVRRPDGCPNCRSLRGAFRGAQRAPVRRAGVHRRRRGTARAPDDHREGLAPPPRRAAARDGVGPRTAIVAGAGPVGILAAVKLRLLGLDVTVVERQTSRKRSAAGPGSSRRSSRGACRSRTRPARCRTIRRRSRPWRR